MKAVERPRRVLFIRSHDLAYSQSFELSASFMRRLASSESTCTVDHLELEAELVTEPAERQLRLRPFLEGIKSGFYDVVVAMHNPAFELLQSFRGDWPKDLPVVFISVRDFDGSLSPNIPAITGNIAQPHIVETLQLARQLYPDRSEMVLLSNRRQSDIVNEQRLQNYLAAHPDLALRIYHSGDMTTDELVADLRTVASRGVVLYLGWRDDKSWSRGVRSQALSELCSQLTMPVFVLRDELIQYGVMGGVVNFSVDHGVDAAERVLAILQGKKASDIPIREIPASMVINWQTFQDAGLPASRLPAKASFLNKPEDFWSSHRSAIILAASAVILVLSALAALSVAVALRNRTIAQHAAIYMRLPVRFMIMDSNGDILFTEHGRGPEKSPDLRGIRNVRDFWDEPIRELFQKALPAVLATGESRTVDYEFQGRLRTGTLSLFPGALFKRQTLLWISQDTEALQLAVREAQETATRFKLTLQAIGDAVVVTAADARITVMNSVAEALTGWPAGEALGRPLDEVMRLCGSSDQSPVTLPIAQALASGEKVELAQSADLIARDGSRRLIADSASPIRDASQRIIGAVMVFRDMTEEYRQKEALQRQNIQLQTASAMANMVYVHGEVEGDASEWKRRVEIEGNEDGRYWGRNADGSAMRIATWVHPEDVAQFLNGYQRLRETQDETVVLRYRAGACVGHERYFEARARVSGRNRSGRQHFFGIIRDVTREEEAKRREVDAWRVFQELLDNLPIAVAVKDIDRHFRYVVCNKYFLQKTGFKAEEVIDRNDGDIGLNSDSVELFSQQDEAVAQSGEQLHSIEQTTQPDGSRAVFQKIKMALTLPSGGRFLIVSGVDITEQHNLLEAERIINNCLSALVLPADFGAKLERVLDVIARQLKCDRVTVGRFLNGGSDYEFLREWSADGSQPLSQIPGGKELVCNYFSHFRQNELQVLSDARDYHDGVIVKTTAARSLLAAPIFIDGELWGSISIAFVHTPRHFTLIDEEVIRSAARVIALAQMQQQHLDQVAAAHRERALILNNINIPIMLFDALGKICAVNTALCNLIGKGEDEILNGKCWELLDCDDHDNCQVNQALNSKKASSRMRVFRGRTFVMTAEPILDKIGNLIYVVESAVDVTDLSEARRLQAQALEAAQAADRAKSYFLATMSHEIRTPLNSVIGFSELLQAGDCTPVERQQYLEAISLSGRALLLLINDVLDLSKLEAGQMAVTLADTDVLALIEEMRAIFQPKAKQKGLDFVVACPANLPRLLLDSAHCRQILFNLIGNALKFTHHGQVSVSVQLTLAESGDHFELRLSVADTGIGITESFKDKLFLPFTQQDMVRGNRQYEGTGLGLSISARLAKRMGGELLMDSTEGVGSTFTFRMPAVERVKTAILPDETAADSGSAAAGQQPLAARTIRALLVDDVPLNLKLLQTILEKEGASVVAVSSASAALDELRKQPFDVVMTDLWMPGMNGAELAQAIRRQDQYQGTKIFAVTADIDASANPGFDAFDGVILKPITRSNLRQILHMKA